MTASTEDLSTHERALHINLDPNIYGTIAEIGAGQEVARWFFRVGGAAGSVAKTISAYDMRVSDEIYGQTGRYVSRDRLVSMLDKEFGLLLRRLEEQREGNTRFFAFAATVSAQNYAGTRECHGWIGLRFQAQPGGEANDIILHVNMRDRTNVQQQEALGILGINLVYSAFQYASSVHELVPSLGSDLSLDRLEIDLVDLIGPEFEQTSPPGVGLALVTGELAEAVMFSPEGIMTAPTEMIRKRPVILQRGRFSQVSKKNIEMLASAGSELAREVGEGEREPLLLMEVSVNNLRDPNRHEPEEYLRRLAEIRDAGQWVLLSRFAASHSLTTYVRRYSQAPLRYSMGISTLAMLFAEEYYTDLAGGLLEAIARLFAENVKIYAHEMDVSEFNSRLNSMHPMQEFVSLTSDARVTTQNLRFRAPFDSLYAFLIGSDMVVSLK